MTSFDDWFSQLAGNADVPYEWQRGLAQQELRSRLIRIPTGMGKTLGVLAAWSWNRVHRNDPSWPRRLVWCLPMRVLAEQTAAVAAEAFGRASVLWTPGTAAASSPRNGRIGVQLLMGGVDAGTEWTLFPEECAVLVGTQDMLLSRALNRGYAAGRARWPLEFGLLSHDALWVMDEVQLMDVGLATSAQLQSYHDDDAQKALRPKSTWWMSATLQPQWLKSVDTEAHHAGWCTDPTELPVATRAKGPGATGKRLSTVAVPAADAAAFASLVLEQHAGTVDGEHGRITLVVCNTVSRACQTFEALQAQRSADAPALELVHSRFRPFERTAWRDRFLGRTACKHGADRIILATQVVEAGVDISAECVVTELAPWPSLVQRFGRCARYGGPGRVLVVDRGQDEGTAPPYEAGELASAWDVLERIGNNGDVGTSALDAIERTLCPEDRERLFPYTPKHLLLRNHYEELFDTTPDLTGADLDVSRFIRSGDERDVQVFWLNVEAHRPKTSETPPSRHRPRREELCAVPFLAARDWLCGPETKKNQKPRLRAGVRAWVWDWLEGDWVIAQRSMLTPGRVVCVASAVGGYRTDRGFDPGWTQSVEPVPDVQLSADAGAQSGAEASQDADDLSIARWKTIAFHGDEAVALADQLATSLDLPERVRNVLHLAAQWHDVGKSHPAFQGAIRCAGRPARNDLAKAPGQAWPRPPQTYRTKDDKDHRPGLRHELASALALFAVLQRHAPRHGALLGPWVETLALLGQQVPGDPLPSTATAAERAVLACTADDFDLLAYLVAAHHGKVRATLHAAPRDQDYCSHDDGRGLPIRGVREGDELPSICIDRNGPPLPATTLSLAPARLGLSPATGRSWCERTLALVARHGPGGLAWLEALVIAADRRASRLATPDPALTADAPASGKDPQ